MKIAFPLTQRKISAHFGHCEEFAVLTVEDGKVVKEEYLTPPEHEPGSHPKFLNEHGVTVVIAGGMGMRAQQLMAENGITSYVGVCHQPLSDLVALYLKGELEAGDNLCDH